jgi:hypothetical protein
VGGSIGNKKPTGTRQNQVTREILYPQRRLSSASLGERGAASVRTWSFGAGVAPASFLRQSLIYPIFIGDASFNQLLKLRFRTKQDRNRLRRQIYAVLDRRSQYKFSKRGFEHFSTLFHV